MSWESTQSYYRMINQGVKENLGGLQSADLPIHSVDFALISALQADSPIPVFDTTTIHAAAAVEFLLGNTKLNVLPVHSQPSKCLHIAVF